MLAAFLRYLRSLRRTAGLGLASAAAVLIVGGLYTWEAYRLPHLANGTLPPLLRGEYIFHDMLIQYGRKVPVRNDIVFLGYDEASLNLDSLWPEDLEASPALKAISSSQGRWPWPRSVQAMILDRLAAAGAKVVAFDLLLLGPSPDDAALRASLDAHADHVVIGANLDVLSGGTINFPSPTLIPNENPPDSRIGYVECFPDRDGKVHSMTFRSSPSDLARNPDAVVYDSLVSAIMRKAGHADLIPAKSVDRLYPLRYSNQYRAHPVYEIFVDALWQQNYHGGADFKDKIVLVGPMAGSMHDTQDTPVGNMPGPAWHLNALSAALSGEFLHPGPLWGEILLIAAAGALAWVVGVGVRQPLTRFGVFIASAVVFVAILIWLYNRYGFLTAAFSPLLCFFLGGVGGLVGEYVIERAEKARVRGVLDRLVSKDIVRELLGAPGSYEALVRGTRRPVTVFFSDVRDFTTLSEAAADPSAFIAQLNEYLGEMVDIVFKYKGTLDKFIGDAVMAVWGSMHTEGTEADACLAVKAALEMRERLAQLNKKWTVEGKQTLAFGMGLNAGEVLVGGLGNENSKMEITVMGDAVNLASRLEGLTKSYKLDLLIGETVARLVKDKFRLRTVDLVRVKGKKKPAEVMTVVAMHDEKLPEAKEEFLATYEDAILLYRRREFAGAKRCLEKCQEFAPNDYLLSYYLHLCDEYLAATPDEDWDGVRLMTSK